MFVIVRARGSTAPACAVTLERFVRSQQQVAKITTKLVQTQRVTTASSTNKTNPWRFTVAFFLNLASLDSHTSVVGGTREREILLPANCFYLHLRIPLYMRIKMGSVFTSSRATHPLTRKTCERTLKDKKWFWKSNSRIKSAHVSSDKIHSRWRQGIKSQNQLPARLLNYSIFSSLCRGRIYQE